MANLIGSVVTLILVGVLNWYSHESYRPGYGFSEYGSYADMAGVGDAVYYLIPVAASALWIVGLVLKRVTDEAAFARMLAFTGVVMSLFWLAIPLLVLADQLEYTHANPVEISQLSVAILIGAAIASIVFVRLVKSGRQ